VAGQHGEGCQSIQPLKGACPLWQDQSCPQNEALKMQALEGQGMVLTGVQNQTVDPELLRGGESSGKRGA
jgi:hypothetical protein